MKALRLAFCLIVIFIFVMGCKKSNQHINVIPLPSEYIVYKGHFKLDKNNSISCNSEKCSREAEFLQQSILFSSGLRIDINPICIKSKGSISLEIDSSINQPEGYFLQITRKQICIKASTSAGIFYGIQSLMQLIGTAQSVDSILLLPTIEINDHPRFAWRGMHFDVSRHFFPKEFMYKLIDLLAMYKLNVLHWHLTDDQGWRIEIKKYPKLTEIAAWREGSPDDPWNYYAKPPVKGMPRYGGFYTQEEIRQIVAYATENHITIVPEIEMPGHSWSVLNAYPELSCSGKLFKPADTTQFEFTDPYCAGNDAVYQLLKDVLTEVIELFPSEYIHIGGDEAKKEPWMKCPKCQNTMKTEGLKTPEELQSYFMRQMVEFLHSKGRKAIGWDEIIEGPMPDDVAVMAWRGKNRIQEAIEKHHFVVNANIEVLYFNMAQTKIPDDIYEEGPYISLETVYNYNPMPDSIPNSELNLMLGLEGCLWTEQVLNTQKAEKRLLPRLLALSEISWNTSTQQRDFNEFTLRVADQFPLLDKKNYDYFLEPPKGLEDKIMIPSDSLIKLESIYPNSRIVYTTDNSKPEIHSQTYSEPIRITKTTTIKARVYLPNGKFSPVVKGDYDELLENPY